MILEASEVVDCQPRGLAYKVLPSTPAALSSPNTTILPPPPLTFVNNTASRASIRGGQYDQVLLLHLVAPELRLVSVLLIFAFLPFRSSTYLQSTTPPAPATRTSSHHLSSTTDAVLSAILTSKLSTHENRSRSIYQDVCQHLHWLSHPSSGWKQQSWLFPRERQFR